MSEAQKTLLLQTKPGIQRDGTVLDAGFYSDGEWVRFQRGRPKKIGGTRVVTNSFSSGASKLVVWSRQDLNAIIQFSSAGIEQVLVDNNGIGAAVSDRTPSGFTGDASTIWSADTQYDDAVGSKATIIVAHASSSMANIDDATASKPCWALAGGDADFVSITDAPAVSGGVFSAAPYTICHGSDGYVEWSNANEPQTWVASTNPGDAGADRVTGAKIVKGMSVRSGSGPAALLWSLDSVLRMDWVGGGAIFKFTTLTNQSSILSQGSVIEFDGMYFWIGVDRFMYFDSSVHELPNSMNSNFFFDNLNYVHRQKVWATKVPRFGEIWWFFPKGDSTVCNHAVVFNVREKFWFDVEVSRAAGMFSQVFKYPVMCDEAGSCYLHEIGKDHVVGDETLAIRSSFTTSNFGLTTGGTAEAAEGLNRWTRLMRIEPDFIQEGDMTVEVIGNEFAQAADVVSLPYSFSPTDGKVDMREQQRHMRLRFISNTAGGSYEGGKILLHLEPGDQRS